jgi:hypothetical protein
MADNAVSDYKAGIHMYLQFPGKTDITISFSTLLLII